MVRGAAEIREFLADGMSAVDSAGVPLITERDEAFVHRATTLLSKHGFAVERQSVFYLTDDYGWQECAAISMGMDPMELRDKFEAGYRRLVFGKRRQGETRSGYYKRVAAARREKADGLGQDDWVSLQMEEALAGSGYQSPATISKATEALGGGLAAVAMTPREHRAVAVCWRVTARSTRSRWISKPVGSTSTTSTWSGRPSTGAILLSGSNARRPSRRLENGA